MKSLFTGIIILTLCVIGTAWADWEGTIYSNDLTVKYATVTAHHETNPAYNGVTSSTPHYVQREQTGMVQGEYYTKMTAYKDAGGCIWRGEINVDDYYYRMSPKSGLDIDCGAPHCH